MGWSDVIFADSLRFASEVQYKVSISSAKELGWEKSLRSLRRESSSEIVSLESGKVGVPGKYRTLSGVMAHWSV